MVRPKSKINHNAINTTIDKKLLKIVRDISEDTESLLIDLSKKHFMTNTDYLRITGTPLKL